MTVFDWIGLAVWSVLAFAVGWSFGSVEGYRRGLKWGADFARKKPK